MKTDYIKEKIASELDLLYNSEENIRLDIVTFILCSFRLLNASVWFDSRILLSLLEKVKCMSLKQLELLDLVNDQFKKINISDENKLLQVIRGNVYILENNMMELHQLQENWLLLALFCVDNDEWFYMKNELDFTFKFNSMYDTSSRESFVLDLVEKSDVREDIFNNNYEKVKTRKEKNNE